MVIFDLQELERASETSGLPMINILRYIKKGGIPRNNKSKYLRINTRKILAGSSFLLDVEGLLKDPCDNVYKEQYIKLAGRRSLFSYKNMGIITLDLSFYPDLAYEQLKYNPLLAIKNGFMHFKYEHLKRGLKSSK